MYAYCNFTSLHTQSTATTDRDSAVYVVRCISDICSNSYRNSFSQVVTETAVAVSTFMWTNLCQLYCDGPSSLIVCSGNEWYSLARLPFLLQSVTTSLFHCVSSQQWYGFFTLAGLCSYCCCDLPLTHLQLLSILLCRLHTLCHINVLCQSNVLQLKAHLCISTLGCTLVCLVGPSMDSP